MSWLSLKVSWRFEAINAPSEPNLRPGTRFGSNGGSGRPGGGEGRGLAGVPHECDLVAVISFIGLVDQIMRVHMKFEGVLAWSQPHDFTQAGPFASSYLIVNDGSRLELFAHEFPIVVELCVHVIWRGCQTLIFDGVTYVAQHVHRQRPLKFGAGIRRRNDRGRPAWRRDGRQTRQTVWNWRWDLWIRRSDNDDTSLESVVRFIGLGDQVSRVHNQRERVLARLHPSQAVQSVPIREHT